jgi:hypothetical protein
MSEKKRFHLIGRVRRTEQPKESDGIDYDLGYYETLEIAEIVRNEKWAAGWGTIDIVDLRCSEDS